jgi:polar amino acid transport system substrate-binding protein
MGSDINDNVKAVQRGEIDILLGPVTATYSRSLKANFTRPYALNRVGVVLLQIRHSLQSIFFTVFVKIFSWTMLFTMIIIIIYSHVFWYLERGKVPSLIPDYPAGVIQMFWACILRRGTFIMPSTIPGRIFQLLWVSASALGLSVLYAAMAATFHIYFGDITTYNSINDFKGKKIVAVKGSVGYTFAIDSGIEVIPITSREAGIEAVVSGQVDGFADSTADALIYIKNHHLMDTLTFAPYIFKVSIMAFALPKGSPLISKINPLLAQLEDDNIILGMCQYYLKQKASTYCF